MKQKIGLLLLYYFRFFAKLQLRKISPLIVGVTGSAGKSSTRDALVCVFKSLGTVKHSAKANSESGIPLDILDLHPKNYSLAEWAKLAFLAPWQLLTNWKKYDVYVVEMGIDSPYPPKNMGYLLSILQPDIGIVLNAGAVHAEPFDHLIQATDPAQRKKELIQLIATEKGRLVTELDSSKNAVIFNDQPEIKVLATNIQAPVTTFGETDHSDIKLTEWQPSLKGTAYTFETKEGQVSVNIAGAALPKHYGFSFAAAVAAGSAAGISLAEASQALNTSYKPPEGRSSLLAGIKNSTIIDSTYNASTGPMLDMLEMLGELTQGRKLAVLGDMREIGLTSQLEHELVAKKAIEICDEIFLIGPQMKEFALAVIKKSEIPVTWYPTTKAAAAEIPSLIKTQDTILVKASQNTLFLELIVEALLAHPDQDLPKLCRRGEYWDQIRRELSG